MLFNSLIFLLFLGLVIPLYYVLPVRFRKIFLLGCSYLFYSYWDWRFLSLILLSTAGDYSVARGIHQSQTIGRKKILLLISILCNLSILGFFKYFNFFTATFNNMVLFWGLGPLDFLHLNILLPVGISFYTFQTLSYTIDVYRGHIEPEDSKLNFALFVAFFPQLVAGPIERAAHLLPQLKKK